jgi:hypothetical protein
VASSSNGNAGTIVLTVECTNQFTGSSSPVLKDFNLVLSSDCSAATVIAPVTIADVPYNIRSGTSSFTFDAFTSNDIHCESEFAYNVKW